MMRLIKTRAALYINDWSLGWILDSIPGWLEFKGSTQICGIKLTKFQARPGCPPHPGARGLVFPDVGVCEKVVFLRLFQPHKSA
jgi:hypothetical protein